ncbi:MAG TPA: 4-(cytidine 5'-diphospho)-2-C-methyl-D-erythritol kinase [Bacteroidales bacterium]|nr:4-(cytidine 5'-diphospho)-2-C-methyl-D-erythritol kinase [Bacteroidales bacterium]
MVGFPTAKINIGLRITGKRSDGYHNIETIFYPVDLCDALEIVEAEDETSDDTITVTGIDPGVADPDNLVIRAIGALRQKHTIPALNIHLHKVIPPGAGLGGGSSDAACTLITVNRQFRLMLHPSELKSIALELGSDCPFFINPVPLHATGRGEILIPVMPLNKEYYIILLNHGIGINTKEAYDNCKPAMPSVSLMELYSQPVSEWKDLIYNDFEEYVFGKYPLTGEFKKVLYDSGALFSSMSGSGSTVYGIFDSEPDLPGAITKYIIYSGLM